MSLHQKQFSFTAPTSKKQIPIIFFPFIVICLLCAPCGTLAQMPAAATVSNPAMEPGFFPIMPWEFPNGHSPNFADVHQGLQSMAECGFTTAAFVTPEYLPLCEKFHLKAIVTSAVKIKWRELSDDQITHIVQTLVEKSGQSPAILGYFLTDEPGIGEFPALGKAVAAVKKFSPGKLAYINLYPDYATLGASNLSQLGTDSYSEYLERYVAQVHPQFISYDNYRVLSSDDLKDSKHAASYYNNLLAVRAVAIKHDLPFWNIVSSNQIRPFTPVPSPANFLMQAYTTLAAGGKGVTWFTYYVRGYNYAPVDKEGRRTQTWTYLKMVNEQLKVIGPKMMRLKSVGVYFTSPAPAEALPRFPGKLIDRAKADSRLMVGEFTDSDGHGYAMIVNLSLQNSTKCQVTAHGDSTKGLEYISPADGSLLPMDKGNFLWLTAGQGLLIKLP